MPTSARRMHCQIPFAGRGSLTPPRIAYRLLFYAVEADALIGPLQALRFCCKANRNVRLRARGPDQSALLTASLTQGSPKGAHVQGSLV